MIVVLTAKAAAQEFSNALRKSEATTKVQKVFKDHHVEIFPMVRFAREGDAVA